MTTYNPDWNYHDSGSFNFNSLSGIFPCVIPLTKISKQAKEEEIVNAFDSHDNDWILTANLDSRYDESSSDGDNTSEEKNDPLVIDMPSTSTASTSNSNGKIFEIDANFSKCIKIMF